MDDAGIRLRRPHRSIQECETSPCTEKQGLSPSRRRGRLSLADAFSKCVARRCASRRRRRAKRETGRRLTAWSIPLQKEKFRAEARTEGRGHGDVAFFEGPLFQPLLQNKKNGGAGKISHVAEN